MPGQQTVYLWCQLKVILGAIKWHQKYIKLPLCTTIQLWNGGRWKWSVNLLGNSRHWKTINYFTRSAADLNASTTVAAVRNYNGGGYVLKLTGYMDNLNETIQTLKYDPWTDNRTRALILEFSVYNAQGPILENLFCSYWWHCILVWCMI